MNAESWHVVAESFPASRKVSRAGRLHQDLRVAMREIALHPSAGEPPLTVYDSSGPYTDRAVKIDIERGLPRLRESWISGGGGAEAYAGRAIQPVDNGLNPGAKGVVPDFPVQRRPYRAR